MTTSHGCYLVQRRIKPITIKGLHQKVSIHNGRVILHNPGITMTINPRRTRATARGHKGRHPLVLSFPGHKTTAHGKEN